MLKKLFRKLINPYYDADKIPTYKPNPQPHPALQHLKITFQPDAYIKFQEDREKMIWSELTSAPVVAAYAKKLSNYLIARCPICQTEYTAKLDLHSLKGLYGQSMESNADQIGGSKQYCEHFFAIHYFINLNGLFPHESSHYFTNYYDVPFISPSFLPDEVPSYAVMHSLPICRIEDGQFVPRYYLYTITYYVLEDYVSWQTFSFLPDRQIRGGILFEQRKAGPRGEWQNILYTNFEANNHPEWWNLPLWVKRKKLLWLDPDSPDLALRSGPVEKFPYANVRGYRKSIEIRDGEFRFH